MLAYCTARPGSLHPASFRETQGRESAREQGTANPAEVKQDLPLWPLIEAGAASPEAVLLWGVIKGQEHVGAQALPWGQEVTT